MIPKCLLKEIEHELTCINGLYASDDKEFKNAFKLDYNILLEKIEKEIHSK
ncbi:MAG: hypothetical protein PUC09_03255 [Methanobrevibacter wolinii]|nr:hypothetical protein [Methanobrevibacter wolinii]